MRQAEALARRPTLALGEALGAAGAAIRISALGGTVILPVLGVASAGGDAEGAVVVLVALAGVAFHVFAYVLNDVVDLEIDRTDPRRVRSPLVIGAVDPRSALALALLMLPVAAWLTALAAVVTGRTVGGSATLAALAAAAIGLGAYDVLGKRTAWPPLADVVQALGWGALVVAGASVAGGPTSLTVALTVYVVLFVTMANGVHGAIRDLPNDGRHGVRTTASLLGAQATTAGRRVVPGAVMAWAWVLQLGLVAVTAAALATVGVASPGGAGAGAITAILLTVLAAALLRAASRAPSDDELLAAGMLHLLVVLAVPIALVADSTQSPLVAVLAATYLLPLLSHGWLRGAVRWGQRRAIDVSVVARNFVVLTRPHNCVAAGLAVAVGAHLGGARLAADGVVASTAIAALVAALVVGAANVANDRADVTEDRINRPERPIAGGRVSPRAAGAFSIALAGAALVLAAILGPAAVAAAAVLAVASFAYSQGLKGTLLVGNVLVAALSASTILYGALTLAAPTTSMVLGAALVFVSVVASEIVKCVGDRDGDRAAGRATVATRLSLGACLRLHGALVGVLAVLVLVPPIVGVAPPAFLVAGLLGIVVPHATVVGRTWHAVEPAAVRPVLAIDKAAWFTGLVSLVFLV
jgi:4-hydroxybenzoate polyprenyltransferase